MLCVLCDCSLQFQLYNEQTTGVLALLGKLLHTTTAYVIAQRVRARK